MERDQTDAKVPTKANSSVKRTGKDRDTESQISHHRDRWLSDTKDTMADSGIFTEFVDSLRIGQVDRAALNRGQSLLGPLEPRPVPRMRYSKGAPLNCSIGDAVNTFRTHRAASMGAASSRERVVIRRLAAKRSETAVPHDFTAADKNRRCGDRLHRASWRDRRHHSLGDTRTGSRKYKRSGSTRGDEFDFELTYKNSDEMVRKLRSRSGADITAGDIQDKTRRSTPGESGGSSGSSDDSRVQHSVDCPMCHHYEPSRFGHVCPPNTPLGQSSQSDEDL